MEHPWEDRIETRKTDDDEWTVDPSTQSALPFDETAPVPAGTAAPAAVRRCESCGAPSDAAGVANLCSACARAFHTVLENSGEPQAPESDDHAAQLDALFKALESAPEPPSPFASPSAFAFASPSPATSPASPFVDAAGLADSPSGLSPSAPRVPFANITPAAEPRSVLFASPLVNSDAPPVSDAADAAAEYLSVLLPKAEPEPAALAASTQLLPDVDFCTVMLPRLSPAQLEAAGILPTVHVETPAAVEPSFVAAVDPVASLVDAGKVIEQAEAVDAAPVAEDQVAIVQNSDVDVTNEPAVPIVMPVIQLKQRDEAPIPPVPAAVSVVEDQVAIAGAVSEAAAEPVAVPQAAAVVAPPASEEEAPAPAAKPKQAAPAKPASAAKPKSGALRSLATAAAVVLIVGAIGVPLSRLWLGRSQEIVPVSAAPAKRPTPAPAAEEKAAPLQAVAAPAVVPSVPAPSAPVAAPTAVPAATRKPAPRVPAKPVSAEAPAPQLAAIAPTFVGAAPSVAALPEPEPVAPAPVAAAPAESPIGPFYETRGVDSAPQVTGRVEPQVPANLQGQSLNENRHRPRAGIAEWPTGAHERAPSVKGRA